MKTRASAGTRARWPCPAAARASQPRAVAPAPGAPFPAAAATRAQEHRAAAKANEARLPQSYDAGAGLCRAARRVRGEPPGRIIPLPLLLPSRPPAATATAAGCPSFSSRPPTGPRLPHARQDKRAQGERVAEDGELSYIPVSSRASLERCGSRHTLQCSLSVAALVRPRMQVFNKDPAQTMQDGTYTMPVRGLRRPRCCTASSAVASVTAALTQLSRRRRQTWCTWDSLSPM